MRKGTIHLYKILSNDSFVLFDFDYNFYNPELKSIFEEKFKEYYMERMIGTETIFSFKRRLKSKLNLMYPYFKQKYEIELRCLDIDFMLNKDLEESFTRDIVNDVTENINGLSNSNTNSNSNASSENSSSQNSNSDSSENGMVKELVPAQNEVGNIESYMSGATKSDTTNNVNENATSKSSDKSNSNLSGNSSIETNNKVNKNDVGKETTKLISKGNIGTTSSAQLKEGWLKVISNLDEEIIQKLEPLFLQIFY